MAIKNIDSDYDQNPQNDEKAPRLKQNLM